MSHAAPTELEIKSILVVSDDPDLTAALKNLVEHRNFVVHTVANSVAALKEIIETDHDIIVCDLMMPLMAGDMFYLAVQKVKPDLARRFLFVTGNSLTEAVETFLRRIDAVTLQKPALSEELVRMISLVLIRTQETAC